jgi:hypothetical protein
MIPWVCKKLTKSFSKSAVGDTVGSGTVGAAAKNGDRVWKEDDRQGKEDRLLEREMMQYHVISQSSAPQKNGQKTRQVHTQQVVLYLFRGLNRGSALWRFFVVLIDNIFEPELACGDKELEIL